MENKHSQIASRIAYGQLVSVVVPVYNRAHLVAQTVGSVCAQSYRNLDIVVVDDCSTDDIERAVATLADPRVRLVRRAKNGGVASARNTGIKAAHGEVIAFHDSDDYCTPDRIELSMRLLASLPADYIGVYGVRIFYDEVTEAGYGAMRMLVRPFQHETPLSGDLSARTMVNNILNFPTLLVTKAALLAAGPLDELLRQNEDWDLSLRLTKIGKFGFVPSPLLLTPTPLDPSVSQARVSRSIRQGARSFARITGKLRRHGFGGPPLAAHYVTTASYLMRIGRPRAARRFYRAALAITPVKTKLLAHYILSFTPGLHARLRKPAKI